jgi:hypothetical protein
VADTTTAKKITNNRKTDRIHIPSFSQVTVRDNPRERWTDTKSGSGANRSNDLSRHDR